MIDEKLSLSHSHLPFPLGQQLAVYDFSSNQMPTNWHTSGKTFTFTFPKNQGPLLLSSIAPGLLLPSFLPSFLTHKEVLQELPDLPPDHDGRGHPVYIIVESSIPASWTGAPPPWKSFNYLPPTSCTADVQSSLLPAPLACSSRLLLES